MPGLTSRGIATTTGFPDNWFYNRLHGYQNLGYRMLVEEDSGVILGAHLLGFSCEEVINLFALAIRNRMPVDEFANTTYAFPTMGYNTGYMF